MFPTPRKSFRRSILKVTPGKLFAFFLVVAIPVVSFADNPLDILSPSSSSSSSSEKKADPLDSILSDLHSAEPSDTEPGTTSAAPFDQALAALNHQVALSAQQLSIYKQQQTQTLLKRQHVASPEEQDMDDTRKAAMNQFSQKIDSTKGLIDHAREARERCLSREEKYQLDKGNARTCERLVQSMRDRVGSLQENTHDLELAFTAVRHKAHSSASPRDTSTPVPMRDPWSRDTMTKW